MKIYNFDYYGTTIHMNLPYENDYIMKCIIKNKTFYENIILDNISYFLDDNRECCVDIGANIGNHSIYFSKILKYKNVHSFEPQIDIYKILLDNIKLNSLETKIIPYKAGLYSKKCKCSIDHKISDNCGGVKFKEDNNGNFEFHTLDEYNLRNVSLLKIDVEGLGYEVLKGCDNFFKYNKPVIWLEMNCYERDAYKAYKEFVLPTNYLLDRGYKLVKKFKCSDYIFKY